MKLKIVISVIIVLIIIGVNLVLDPFDQNWPTTLNQVLKTDTFDPLQTVRSVLYPPYIIDAEFKVEKYVTGLKMPTTISFIGDDMLVLEKNSGKIRLVREGQLQSEPVFDANISAEKESGMLGIASNGSDVYLFFTETVEDGGEILGNHIYKLKWNGESLEDPVLLNKLPYNTRHNGGVLTIGLDGTVYAVIGDVRPAGTPIEEYGIMQNMPRGEIDNSGGIIIVGFENSILSPSESTNPLDHYYAIGIRNSFGLAVDPITGNLWMTENGEDDFDEINLVLPKFNSGWIANMGPLNQKELQFSFPEEFIYSDPEFSWEATITPTGLTFVNSEPFQKYQDSLFVADCPFGNLYKFTLNTNRTGFVFNDPNLSDLVANKNPGGEKTIGGFKNLEPMNDIIFGGNFGCITDLEFGPDGYMYIVSFSGNEIFRIVPTNNP